MSGVTEVGWVFSLANNSQWGEIEKFWKMVEEIRPDEDGRLVLAAGVWGTLQPGSPLPSEGDGFAFYHSSRALFPPLDEFKRKPRITLMGQLLDIGLDGRQMERICVSINPEIFHSLKHRPIVRDDRTRRLFEKCGIVAGRPSSLYYADRPTWAGLVAEIK
jgi:hypothetical protein